MHDANEIRQSECNGLVLMTRVKAPDANSGTLVKQRNACALCGQIVDTFCLGCKRYLCFNKDRSKELMKKFGDDGINGVTDLRTNTFGLSQAKIDSKGQKSTNTIHGVRSCYHIAHELVIDEELSSKAQGSNFYDRAAGISVDESSHVQPSSTNSIACCHLTQNFYGISTTAPPG